MATRNVVLTERQETLIEALVESGRYQNASEVLRDGLAMIERREAEFAAKLKALREAVGVAEEAYKQGDFVAFDSAADLKRHLDSIRKDVIKKRRRS